MAGRRRTPGPLPPPRSIFIRPEGRTLRNRSGMLATEGIPCRCWRGCSAILDVRRRRRFTGGVWRVRRRVLRVQPGMPRRIPQRFFRGCSRFSTPSLLEIKRRLIGGLSRCKRFAKLATNSRCSRRCQGFFRLLVSTIEFLWWRRVCFFLRIFFVLEIFGRWVDLFCF